MKRSTVVDAGGLHLGAIATPANRHDFAAVVRDLGRPGGFGVAARADERARGDRGYDSKVTCEKLETGGLTDVIAEKGKLAPPLRAAKRWIVERTNFWHNAHKRLS